MNEGDTDARLFCRILTSLGFVTSSQIEACCESKGVDGVKEIGEALLREGLLSDSQLEFALGIRGHRDEESEQAPNGSPGHLFGRIAVMKRLATEGQVEECLEIQEELKRWGCYVRLGELLVRKAYLARKDRDALLEEQQEEAPAPTEGRAVARERALTEALAAARVEVAESHRSSADDRRDEDEALAAAADEDDEARAFSLLVQLKRLVASGKIEECREVAAGLSGHPRYGAVAERLVHKAYLSRAAVEARTGGGSRVILRCGECGTAVAVERGEDASCPRCGTDLRGKTPG